MKIEKSEKKAMGENEKRRIPTMDSLAWENVMKDGRKIYQKAGKAIQDCWGSLQKCGSQLP